MENDLISYIFVGHTVQFSLCNERFDSQPGIARSLSKSVKMLPTNYKRHSQVWWIAKISLKIIELGNNNVFSTREHIDFTRRDIDFRGHRLFKIFANSAIATLQGEFEGWFRCWCTAVFNLSNERAKFERNATSLSIKGLKVVAFDDSGFFLRNPTDSVTTDGHCHSVVLFCCWLFFSSFVVVIARIFISK